MMTRSEIEQHVIAFLRDTLQLDEAQLLPTTELKRDLGLSSLDMKELVVFIYRTFSVQPILLDVLAWVTLADLYTYIELHQS